MDRAVELTSSGPYAGMFDELIAAVTAEQNESVFDAPRLRMLDGGTVAVDGTLLNTDQAEIVATNVEASNGVIHAIGPVDGDNGVLLP